MRQARMCGGIAWRGVQAFHPGERSLICPHYQPPPAYTSSPALSWWRGSAWWWWCTLWFWYKWWRRWIVVVVDKENGKDQTKKKNRSKKRTNITVTDNPRSCDFWNKNKQGLNKEGEVAALFFAARYKNRVWQCGWQRRWPVVTEQSWLWQSREAKKEEDRAAVSGWWQRTRKETGRKKTGAGAPWAWGTRFLQMRHPLF